MKATTTRQARQALFEIDRPSADALRLELFKVEAQDSPLPEEFKSRYEAILEKDNQARLESEDWANRYADTES